MILDTEYIKQHILTALKEDVREGDHSSLACIDRLATSKAKLVAKQDCIICGVDIARMVFELVDDRLQFQAFASDGQKIKKGDIVFKVEGSAISILTAERTLLNYMQRLSGIATTTSEYVSLIAGTSARLLDTRKTTPTMRILEKYAVKTGGGTNHRIGLFDMIMLKDNHIDFAGGIEKAIDRTLQYLKDKQLDLKIWQPPSADLPQCGRSYSSCRRTSWQFHAEEPRHRPARCRYASGRCRSPASPSRVPS